MTRALLLASALAVVAAPALAQSQPGGRSGSDLTRDLNSAPPGAVAASPASQPVAAPVAPAPRPAAATPTMATNAPVQRPAATAPTSAARPAANPPAPPANVPTTAPTTAPIIAPAPPPPAVLDAAALRALPFAVEVPRGFEVVSRSPAPGVSIYQVRKGGVPFVMIYAGAQSQFPIYDGERRQLGGRTSVVVTEDGKRRALEHLFDRPDAPQQIHVWVASVEDADKDQAEAIAQSVDPR